MSAVPDRCTLCNAAIPPGRTRCPGCGRAYGEDNRCPSCQSIAAVREVSPGSYVCAACSRPRTRLRGTVVDADFAHELGRKATRDRVLSYVFYPVGGGIAALGATFLTIGQAWLEGGFGTFSSVFGAVMLAVGAVGLFFANRASRSARRLRARATDAKLVLTVGRAAKGLTATDVAAAAQLPAATADARLTDLAKRGQVELDVDDAGTIRYRVASPEADMEIDALAEAEAEAAARRSIE